jgi:pimeloyl-ACP methyl ester carboxylesterase
VVFEDLQIRIYGDAAQPTLIYLPGLHGDWTLVGSFRKALRGRVRFVEITYPRTLTWSLEDYAAGVETALAEKGISRGWLLGESFGSQVIWQIATRGKLQTEGIILAGGFARHPLPWGARLAERICGCISLALLTWILFGYARLARFRYRRAPETLANIQEFIARRTEPDQQAIKHRLRLVAHNDPRAIVERINTPVYALSGLIDPIVPWFFVRPWLCQHCPALRDYKIIGLADHNVLGTAPEASAQQVVKWINYAGWPA